MAINPSLNPYAWTAQSLAPGDTEPAPGTTASFGPTQGSLLLFKLPTSVYDNRPLTLEIRRPGRQPEALGNDLARSLSRVRGAPDGSVPLQTGDEDLLDGWRRGSAAGPLIGEEGPADDPRRSHRGVADEPGVGVLGRAGARDCSGPAVSTSSAVPVLPATSTPGIWAAVPVPN